MFRSDMETEDDEEEEEEDEEEEEEIPTVNNSELFMDRFVMIGEEPPLSNLDTTGPD